MLDNKCMNERICMMRNKSVSRVSNAYLGHWCCAARPASTIVWPHLGPISAGSAADRTQMSFPTAARFPPGYDASHEVPKAGRVVPVRRGRQHEYRREMPREVGTLERAGGSEGRRRIGGFVPTYRLGPAGKARHRRKLAQRDAFRRFPVVGAVGLRTGRAAHSSPPQTKNGLRTRSAGGVAKENRRSSIKARRYALRGLRLLWRIAMVNTAEGGVTCIFGRRNCNRFRF